MTRLVCLLVMGAGCAKSPSPNAPILGATTSTPAPGQRPLVALTCASAAFNDVKVRAGVPLAYRTRLDPADGPGEYSVVISLEPAHVAATLADGEEQAAVFGDEFILRTEYLASGRWDGESIRLSSDNFSMSLGRIPGKKLTFYDGSITIANEHGVPMSCWSTPLALDYRYDPASGKCLDQYGETGQNHLTLAFVRDNQNGECVDLGHVNINEEDYSYPKFQWTLRGANLSNIDMVFAHFVNSSFEGANLEGMNIGYASVSGTMDPYTRLPLELCETLSDTKFTCAQ